MFFMSPIRASDKILKPVGPKLSPLLKDRLPQELVASTQIIREDYVRAKYAEGRAAKTLARKMAEESLNLPAKFIIEHGTLEMIKHVGVIAMRAVIRHLSINLEGRGFYRWVNYTNELRFRDKRRKVLLGHMMHALRAGHDRAQMIMLRQWLKISKNG